MSSKHKDFLDITILLIISQGETYGYELSKKMNQLNPEFLKIGEGTLYPSLARLEGKGYLSSVIRDAGGRTRKYYMITPEGGQYLHQKLKEREAENRIIISLNSIQAGY